MATPSAGRPRWQRNPFFQFFASVKLAVVLLAVIIIASIAGTIWESSFDAKVARAYVYGAPWFNIWLLLLVTNLTVSAVSRWPWRKHHVAFLVTHLGIITLLFGSLIGRIWGIEGTITLFKGEPPSNRLLIDERQLRVRDTDGVVKAYRAEFIHRPPTPQRPWDLGPLASGARLSIIDHATAIESKLNPKPLGEGGTPAVHFTITTSMMGQRLESWLLADDDHEGHGTFNMGLATIDLKRGIAPPIDAAQPGAAPPPGAEVEIEESIFAFTKAPDQQVSRVAKGGSTGAKVVLSQPSEGNKGSVGIAIGDNNWTHDVAASLGRDTPLEGSGFTMRVENYWPDFRIEGGKPGSVSEQPNNPAVVVTIRGHGLPIAKPANDPHGAPDADQAAVPNRLTLFIADDGAITYDLHSRNAGRSTGKLDLDAPLPTGWADWQLSVDRVLPHAEHWMEFSPATANTTANLPDGIRIRVQQGSETIEQWAPSGWQIAVETRPQPIQVSYGFRQQPLPIALELMQFEVERNEGSDSPASFKSTVRVTDREGHNATGQCWMNNPFNFPGRWWNTWSGLTFKMSQASWNPENLGQSTIQILRDPGWLLKWVGSLLVCAGIYMLFYMKQFRKPSGSSVKPASAEAQAGKPQLVGAET